MKEIERGDVVKLRITNKLTLEQRLDHIDFDERRAHDFTYFGSGPIEAECDGTITSDGIEYYTFDVPTENKETFYSFWIRKDTLVSDRKTFRTAIASPIKDIIKKAREKKYEKSKRS